MKDSVMLWLGNQSAFQTLLEADKNKLAALANPQLKAAFFDDDEETKDDSEHHLLSVQGSVGVIAISGSLINGNAGWYQRYCGITGYNDIRDSLIKAVANPSIKSILLNVASNGGHVAGCHETAQLIRRIDKAKPVVAYSGSSMQSAAIWLGSSARYVVAAETAQVGSVGVMTVHQSYEKALENEGIKATVIRAGEEKCLANPYENLSEKALANLTAQAEYIYNIFIGHVSDCRGLAQQAGDSAFGQGREFFGGQALAAGLIDKVGTYEDAYAKATALGDKKKPANTIPGSSIKSSVRIGATNMSQTLASSVASTEFTADNAANLQGQKSMQTNPPLTQEQIAELAAAGVNVTGDGEAEADKPETVASTDAPTLAATTTATATATSPDALAVLQDMLKTTQADLLKAQTDLAVTAKSSSESVAKLQGELEAFSAIARTSVQTMGLHFGLTPQAVSAMGSTQLLAEHSRLSTAMREKFKVGRVSVAAVVENTAAAASNVDDNFMARAKKLPGGN